MKIRPDGPPSTHRPPRCRRDPTNSAARSTGNAARFRAEHGPVEEGCDCYTCRNYSAAYVHHLLRAEEQLYYRLGPIHNIRFMLRLANDLRAAIIAGNYTAFRDDFLARYIPASEQVREEQRQKWRAARLH